MRIPYDTNKGRVLHASMFGVVPFGAISIQEAVVDEETITIGSHVFEFDDDVAPGDITTGNIRVDVSSEAGYGMGTLTITDGQNASADETVTVGDHVYTFKAAPSAADEVDIGTDDEGSAANLAAAINAGAGEGTAYGTGTVANAYTSAVAVANTVVLTAKTAGSAGNVATTETMTQGAFGAATLEGGGTKIARVASAALKAAINNAEVGFVASDGNTANNLIITMGTVPSSGDVSIAETMSGSTNVVSDLTGGSVNGVGSVKRVATAADVSEGQLAVTFEPPDGKVLYDVSVGVFSVSSGAVTIVAWDGAVAVDSGIAIIDNSGSTDFEAGHIIVMTPLFA